MSRGAAQRIAVVGAGLCGVTLGHALRAKGHEVLVIEKDGAPGGRCATRRNGAGWFDHGAPHAQQPATPAFAAQLREWESLGLMAASPGRAGAVAGLPSMNAWACALARGLPLQSGTHVAALEREAGAWRLRVHDGPGLHALFDAVAVAAPAEQAVPLLSPHDSSLADTLRDTRSAPRWVVMAAWPGPLPLRGAPPCDDDPMATLARAIRQGWRDGGNRWVLHAGTDWSANNLDAKPEAVTQRLLAAFADAAGARLARPSWSGAHCWRHAHVPEPRPEPFGWNQALKLGACGDAWHAEDGAQGLERAWMSARALAGNFPSAA